MENKALQQIEDMKNRIKEIEDLINTPKEKEGKRKFFSFSQNNSGGSFVSDKDLCEWVIIEAYNWKDANRRAIDIGIYFDGCDTGMDCSCCGDRWYAQHEDEEGTEIPMIYGRDIREEYADTFRKRCIIYYIDGRKEEIIFKTEKDCPKHDWELFDWTKSKKCKICGYWEEER